MERSPLDFERLDVYRCAIDFLALAVRITTHMPRGHADEQGKALLSRIVAMLSKMNLSTPSSWSCSSS